MTVLDRTTLAPSDPSASIASVGGSGGIPPAVGNSPGSGSSAGGNAPRLCLPGGNAPRLCLSGGSAPRPGDPAAEPPSACVRAASAALRPARGTGVLIRLLRCGGPSGPLSLDAIGFRPGIGGIRLGWARFGRPVLHHGGPGCVPGRSGGPVCVPGRSGGPVRVPGRSGGPVRVPGPRRYRRPSPRRYRRPVRATLTAAAARLPDAPADRPADGGDHEDRQRYADDHDG